MAFQLMVMWVLMGLLAGGLVRPRRRRSVASGAWRVEQE
jgi:hypothetical protein